MNECIFILKMKQWRLEEVQRLAQGHWQGQSQTEHGICICISQMVSLAPVVLSHSMGRIKGDRGI